MHIRRSCTVLSATLLLMLPLASHAAKDDAMEACIKAFVDTHLADQKVIVDREPSLMLLAGREARAQKIDLVAKGRDSGKELARATCIANSNGVVTTLEGTPANAMAAR